MYRQASWLASLGDQTSTALGTEFVVSLAPVYCTQSLFILPFVGQPHFPLHPTFLLVALWHSWLGLVAFPHHCFHTTLHTVAVIICIVEPLLGDTPVPSEYSPLCTHTC